MIKTYFPNLFPIGILLCKQNFEKIAQHDLLEHILSKVLKLKNKLKANGIILSIERVQILYIQSHSNNDRAFNIHFFWSTLFCRI